MDNKEEMVEATVLELDGRDFIVVKELTHNDNKYIYVISDDDKKQIALLKETEEDGIPYVESVTDEKEFNLIMAIVAKELLNELK